MTVCGHFFDIQRIYKVRRHIATLLVLLLVALGDHLLVAGEGGCSDWVPNGHR